MKFRLLNTALAAGLAFALFSPEPAATSSSSSSAASGRTLVLQLKGTAIAENRDIDTDGDGITDTNASCFEVGLYDPKTGRRIGSAVDCLSNVTVPIDDDPMNAPMGWNIALTGTTFFHFPGGSLVTQGLTTVRPVLQPTSRDGVTYSHATGANGDGGVQYGSGRFEEASGMARLSGLVDIARLVSHGEITFDCVFIVELD